MSVTAGWLLLVPTVSAQDAGARSWVLTPGAEVSETLTNNYRLRADEPASDAITRMTGRLSVRGHSSRLQGFLDYSLSGLVYARHSNENTKQQSLNSSLTANLVDNRLTLEASASITRSAISAFGAANSNSELVNSNTTELRTLRLAPRLRGELGGVLGYSGDVYWSASNAAGRDENDSSTRGASLHIQPLNRAKLGWSADLRQDVYSFRQGRQTDTSSLSVGASYKLDMLDLEVHASGGAERSNLSSLDQQTRGTWGVGLSWVPSPRTRADFDYGERFYGRTHNLRLEYRTPRTIWQASASRSLNSSNGQGVAGARSTAFQLFFNQLASVEPDLGRRLERTLQLLSKAGLDPNAQVDSSFLAAAATVVDAAQLSAAWRGQRQTAVLTLMQDTNRRIDGFSALVDDLSTATRVRSRSASLNLSHQLRPDASVTLAATWRESVGTQATQYSQQRDVNLSLSQSFGPYLTGSVGLRRSLYDTPAAPYSESALTLNLGARF